jgi:hypothetical protein
MLLINPNLNGFHSRILLKVSNREITLRYNHSTTRSRTVTLLRLQTSHSLSLDFTIFRYNLFPACDGQLVDLEALISPGHDDSPITSNSYFKRASYSPLFAKRNFRDYLQVTLLNLSVFLMAARL